MNEQPSMPAVADDEPACCIRLCRKEGIFTCTRPPGHDGDHAAHGMDDVIPVHTWPQDGAQ